MTWFLRRPSARELDAELRRAASLAPTCAPLGFADDAAMPPGFRRSGLGIEIVGDFEKAREALESFSTHRLGWLFLHPPGARVAEGRDVLTCVRVGPLWSVNPCRIVRVERSPGRFAYVYATLRGHAERGEEIFSVSLLPSGRLLAETWAVSRPDHVLARLGSPIAAAVQRRAHRGYLEALAREAAS